VTAKSSHRGEGDHPLDLFPYGLLIAASFDGESPIGIVLTWAMQVSFDPPLIAAAMERPSRMRTAVQNSGCFTLSFLPKATGATLARDFLRSFRHAGSANMPLILSPSRMPHVKGALAWVSCRVRQEISTGDHDTVIGEVIESGGDPGAGEVLSLKDTGWRYRQR